MKQNIITLIERTEDVATLNRIESLLHQRELHDKINKLFIQRGWPDTDKLGYRGFRIALLQMITNAPTSFKSKVDYITYLSDESTLILDATMVKEGWAGTIDDLVPDHIRSNETYQHIHLPLFQLVIKSKDGKGEYWILLHGVKTCLLLPKSSRGDVEVDGVGIELKDATTGGSIHPATGNSHRKADELCDRFLLQIANNPLFTDEATKLLNLSGGRGKQAQQHKMCFHERDHIVYRYLTSLPDQERKQEIKQYLEQLYSPGADIEVLADKIVALLGTSEVKFAFADFVYNRYAAHEGFGSMMLLSINQDEGIGVINIPANNTLSEYSKNLRVGVALHRGGNTQAVPDGYVALTAIDLTKPQTKRPKIAHNNPKFVGLTKRVAAETLFKEAAEQGKTRQYILDLFKRELNMSEPGAAAYYNSLKNKR